MHGSAIQRGSNERSSSEPSSQVMISMAAKGLGARLSASEMPAPASVLMAIPARISPSGLSARRASSISGASAMIAPAPRSEEHTSELQSLMRISYAVFCLKKKKKKQKEYQ